MVRLLVEVSENFVRRVPAMSPAPHGINPNWNQVLKDSYRCPGKRMTDLRDGSD